MKKILLLVLFIDVVFQGVAQTPNWKWAERSNGGGLYMEGKAIYTSRTSGDLFFGTRIAQTMTLAGNTVTGNAANDVAIGKVTNAGTGVWYQCDNYPSGGGGENYMYAFYKDDADNTYSTGEIQGANQSYFDKYNSAGVRQFGTAVTGGSGYGIVADKAGNVYVSGAYGGSITFGGTTLNSTSSNGNDYYLVKYDPTGTTCLWAVSSTGGSYVGGRNLTIDQSGNIYMVGAYTGSPTFGTLAQAASTGNGNLFIAEFDPATGKALKVTTAPGVGFTSNGSYNFWEYWYVTADSCANLYVTGHYDGTATFGSHSITSAGGDDIFVAKCLNDGTWAWAKSAGGASGDGAYGITLDKYNQIYIDGSFNGGSGSGGSAQFDNTTVTTTSTSSDLFVAKYDNLTGNLLWVQTAGGDGVTNAEGLTVDNNGFVYVVGSYQESGGGTGTSTFGSTSFTPDASNTYIILAALDTVPLLKIADQPDSVYCPGTSSLLPYTATGTFNNGNTFTAVLSDSTGSFTNPIILGSTSSTGSGSIPIAIPANTPSGKGYIIKVVSSNPVAVAINYYFCNNGATPPPSTVRIGGNFATTISKNTSVCPGTQVPLNITGGTTYLWSPLATLTCDTCHNPTATPSVTTTYYVMVTNNTCPPLKDSVVVTIIPFPVLVAGRDTSLCTGQSASLSVSGAATYVWSPAAGLSCVSCANPIATPSSSTTYSVTGTNQGCSKIDSVLVTVIPPPTLVLQDMTICSNVATQLNATTNGSLQWSPGDGLSCFDCNNPVAQLFGPMTYTVTASTGVCTTTGTINVSIDTPFVYAGTDTTIFKGTNAQLLAEGATTYSWLPTDGLSNSSIFDPVASPTSTTNYTVIGYDAFGCATTSQVLVTVNDPCLIPLPNAFSPNNDGINDLFNIVNPFIDKVLDFEIYNRWGEMVFQTNYIDHGWDGTFGGRPEPVGTYVYFVKSICQGNEVTYKGNVTLIR